MANFAQTFMDSTGQRYLAFNQTQTENLDLASQQIAEYFTDKNTEIKSKSELVSINGIPNFNTMIVSKHFTPCFFDNNYQEGCTVTVYTIDSHKVPNDVNKILESLR